mmetsp:Transcript_40597/g.115712  ORF Transcript_40597/g.115712 Transcript_40597/m.115712 type:complete len:144 (-) Transcript_40597:42-473(-)
MENYLLHEPKEDGKHILVIFGPATEARFGLSFRELELLWKGRRFEDCVEQMKELGQLFLADNKEVIYVILLDGGPDWVEKWTKHEAEGAEARHVFKYLKEQGINILFGGGGRALYPIPHSGYIRSCMRMSRRSLSRRGRRTSA